LGSTQERRRQKKEGRATEGSENGEKRAPRFGILQMTVGTKRVKRRGKTEGKKIGWGKEQAGRSESPRLGSKKGEKEDIQSR